MKLADLKRARQKHGWRQVEAARRLGVSQPYLAMLESGKRNLTEELERKAALAYGLSPEELPVQPTFVPAGEVGPQRWAAELSQLDYPGFAYVRSHLKRRNPAEVLLGALAQDKLEARTAEALPWLLLRYWRMDFDWLVDQAKRFDLQNRLGFVVSLALRVSEGAAEEERTTALAKLEAKLNYSRLAREDCFPRPPRKNAERKWLMRTRSEEARHWNMLTDLRPEHLQYAE